MYRFPCSFVHGVGPENPDLLGLAGESGRSEAAMTSGGPSRVERCKKLASGTEIEASSGRFCETVPRIFDDAEFLSVLMYVWRLEAASPPPWFIAADMGDPRDGRS